MPDNSNSLAELQKNNLILSEKLKEICVEKGLRVATAESLTGGLISATIVAVPGSSDYFDRGFSVYNNQAKEDVLGVSVKTISAFTEVSGQCVQEMASGALARSRADLAVAVSGVAGPGLSGGNPAGTVWIGVCRRSQSAISRRFLFEGDRTMVREFTVFQSLSALLAMAEDLPLKNFSRL